MTDLLDLIGDRCPHGVSQRNGGWTLERDPGSRYRGMWVHGDEWCRRPKQLTVQSLPEDTVAATDEELIAGFREPMHLIAVDPGDEHVGVAIFTHSDSDTWRCSTAFEMRPGEMCDWFARVITTVNTVEALVIERFRLYADKALTQRGSEFETAQMIGVLKWLARQNNEHARLHVLKERDPSVRLSCQVYNGVCTDPTKPTPRNIEIVLQMADIKKPTLGVLRSRGLRSTAKRLKAGDHCLDAELHGWHYLLKDA